MVNTIHILTLIQHTCSKTRGDVWQLSVSEIYFEVNHKKIYFSVSYLRFVLECVFIRAFPLVDAPFFMFYK